MVTRDGWRRSMVRPATELWHDLELMLDRCAQNLNGDARWLLNGGMAQNLNGAARFVAITFKVEARRLGPAGALQGAGLEDGAPGGVGYTHFA